MFPTMMSRTDFDSAALAGMASIAHPLRQAGHWRLAAAGDDAPPRHGVDIVVREGGQARLGLDLACHGPDPDGALVPAGMLNLAAQSARAGCHALLYRGDQDEPAWDSRLLQPGDFYACLPLRPGSYRIENLVNGAVGGLRIRYPDPRAIAEGRQLATAPLHVGAGSAIAPDGQVIDPGQALVFAIDSPCRLAITLQQADDGPPDLAAWRERRSQAALEKVFGRR